MSVCKKLKDDRFKKRIQKYLDLIILSSLNYFKENC